MKQMTLKAQDVALLVKIAIQQHEKWRQADLASELGLQQGEVAKSIYRLKKANLIYGKRANRAAVLEFILHAIKYMFPVEIGALAVGVTTAMSAPAHEKSIVQDDNDVYVWPSHQGHKRGQTIKPLYSGLADAALKDPEFYGMMAAIEIIRVGRARERGLAEKYIERKIKSS